MTQVDGEALISAMANGTVNVSLSLLILTHMQMVILITVLLLMSIHMEFQTRLVGGGAGMSGSQSNLVKDGLIGHG